MPNESKSCATEKIPHDPMLIAKGVQGKQTPRAVGGLLFPVMRYSTPDNAKSIVSNIKRWLPYDRTAYGYYEGVSKGGQPYYGHQWLNCKDYNPNKMYILDFDEAFFLGALFVKTTTTPWGENAVERMISHLDIYGIPAGNLTVTDSSTLCHTGLQRARAELVKEDVELDMTEALQKRTINHNVAYRTYVVHMKRRFKENVDSTHWPDFVGLTCRT
eukprot:Sspe_Gene.6074::Locus_2035_Transcript_2_2_Confidence_0.667_Length_3909::g.6074::m.6074